MQGFFGQGMQFPGQMQFPQPGFVPNIQQNYISLGDDRDEDTYDPELNPTLNGTQLAG